MKITPCHTFQNHVRIMTSETPRKVKIVKSSCDPHQLGPRYKEQLMSDGGAYSPFHSILLVLTHDFIITCVYGPTGRNGHERKDADAALRTIVVPFE